MMWWRVQRGWQLGAGQGPRAAAAGTPHTPRGPPQFPYNLRKRLYKLWGCPLYFWGALTHTSHDVERPPQTSGA